MVLPMEDKKALVCHRCKWNAKNIKTLEGKFLFVLRHDVYMESVTSLCSRALVGRLEYCHMSKKAWVDLGSGALEAASHIHSNYYPACQ